jgi:hypothetical protein
MKSARACLQLDNEKTNRLVAHNLGSNYIWCGEKLLLKLSPLLRRPALDYPRLRAKRDQIKLDKTLSWSVKQGELATVRTAWSHTWDFNQTLALTERLTFPEIPCVAAVESEDSLGTQMLDE